ncbi:MAG: 16S rRNA (uracil(1498)-N(3))-methyltransferase [Planctomycetes bacterium]|nr:16S rRNA (uracil(1498)-N(3))-methyltransferase [Planctomycetota bacterium]
MPKGSRSLPSPPAFFLAEEASGEPRLCGEDEQHALRVLRLGAGEPLIGLDGRGGRFPMRVRGVEKRALTLEFDGEAEQVPEPGAAGSPLPWFELDIAWPRRTRVEDMLNRLVQLGAAAIRPLIAQQRGPEDVPEEVPARLSRVAREACKQSGRAWLPVFEPPQTTDELLRSRTNPALSALDPRAGLPFDLWLRSLQPGPDTLGTRAQPIRIAIGPEGGWSGEERRAWMEAGASFTWLGPHVLRVETAAEAAMAVAAAVHGRPPSASFSD